MQSTNSRAAKGDALRKAILDAASKLFIKRGLGGTSMQDIAAELGLTRTAVYYYFKNKQEILKGLTEDVTLKAKRLTEKAAARRNVPVADALRELIVQYASLILSRPDEFRVVDRNEVDMPPKLATAAEAARRGTFENFSALIQRGIDSGELRRVDARVAALSILGMCNWSAWWFKPDGRMKESEIAALIAELGVNGLLAAPGSRLKNPTVQERLQVLRNELDDVAHLISRGKS